MLGGCSHRSPPARRSPPEPKATGRSRAFINCNATLLYYFPTSLHRAISSVVERLLHTQEVAGSNPASRTIFLLRSERGVGSKMSGTTKKTPYRHLIALISLFRPANDEVVPETGR